MGTRKSFLLSLPGGGGGGCKANLCHATCLYKSCSATCKKNVKWFFCQVKFLNNCVYVAFIHQHFSAQRWKFWKDICCIFWPVFGCCALQMLVKICFVHKCCIRNVKKEQKEETSNDIIAEVDRWKVLKG